MEPHIRFEGDGKSLPVFPSLPIVTPDPPSRRSQQEKYGGLFYFGIAGLVAVLSLVSWFGYGVWSMRDVWGRIYVVHDASKTEVERIQAAYALGKDPKLNQDQRWEMSLRKPLPTLARYLLAESMNSELVARDPAAYVNAVAKSPGWPDWLRLVLARPLALAAIDGVEVPKAPLEVLAAHQDPEIQLWASFVLVSGAKGDPGAGRRLDQACDTAGPNQELACLLRHALKNQGDRAAQTKMIDEATAWCRDHHPEIAPLWKGWTVEGGQLVHKAG
ncbi:hypothetical protein [Singulisphaera sp. PoT]|uniref:hypothetical protein n=1 Tax=Singulisphaera sp. PoT TaxID=3411797 RepID=UPI003BF61568